MQAATAFRRQCSKSVNTDWMACFRRHRNGLIYQQQAWDGDWRVVVICPHRGLHFGALTPVQEFVERRVLWIELQPRDGQAPITPLARVLSLLLEP